MQNSASTPHGRICYGYTIDENNQVQIHQEQANVVSIIFSKYLAGYSLGKLSDMLFEKAICSPTGNAIWSRAVLDKMLSNGKYVPHIISMEQFMDVQYEKTKRSNIDYDNSKRKSSRFSSNDTLGGLIVCAECGANYRRITKSSEEVVWRCANRVEHGKKTCRTAPTIAEADIIIHICNKLKMKQFDISKVRQAISRIYIHSDSHIDLKRKCRTLSR